MSSSNNGFSGSNPNNSFYASFKIYINKFSSQTKAQQKSELQTSAAKTNNAANPVLAPLKQSKIVRIERIECNEDEVFLENPQNVEVHIKVDPPSKISPPPQPRKNRENSPVFYLEPDDWCEDVIPKVLTSPTRALSPCGCGKAHKNSQMESVPEEPSLSHAARSCSGTYLTLPRNAMISELAAQQKNAQNRQRKITIPVLQWRAVSLETTEKFVVVILIIRKTTKKSAPKCQQGVIFQRYSSKRKDKSHFYAKSNDHINVAGKIRQGI